MNGKVNLAEKLAQFDDAFAPRIVGNLNDYKLMVVKARGELSGTSTTTPTTSSSCSTAG